MKTKNYFSIQHVSVILLLILSFSSVQAQNLSTGTWEGTFMNDFKTVLNFSESDEVMAGSIQMYSEERLIQDDKLSEIEVNDNSLRFYIEAKKTQFKGKFVADYSVLSGNFIFPDGSEHPFTAERILNATHGHEDEESPATKAPVREFLPEELRSDLDYLKLLLEKKHPRLYAHISESLLSREFMMAEGKIIKRMKLEEFYRIIAPLTAKARCSHTGLRLPTEYTKDVHHEAHYFPLEIFAQDDKIYTLSSLRVDHSEIKSGSEIVAINDVAAGEIIHELLEMIPAEGQVQSTAYNALNRQFQDWFYLLDSSHTFAVSYIEREDTLTVCVPSCNYDAFASAGSLTVNQKPVSYRFDLELNAGYLRLPTFGIQDMDYYLFLLDSIFKEISDTGTKTLVLDLRNNSGGHPIFAAQLLSYLTSEDFTWFKRNPDIPDFEPLYHPMQPNPLHYEWLLYVFVNGGCLSTTGHFIGLLDYHADPVFIGETPGSTYSCNDFSFRAVLPHTRIEANIPQTVFETAVPDSARRVPFIVDHEVKTTVDDRLNSRDGYFSVL